MKFDRSIDEALIDARAERSSTAPPEGASACVRVKVCMTCDRYNTARDEISLGRSLAQDVQNSLAAVICNGTVAFRRVECLSGCRHPANVELILHDTFAIRLSGLRVGDFARVTSLVTAGLRGPMSHEQIFNLPQLRGFIAHLRSASIP